MLLELTLGFPFEKGDYKVSSKWPSPLLWDISTLIFHRKTISPTVSQIEFVGLTLPGFQFGLWIAHQRIFSLSPLWLVLRQAYALICSNHSEAYCLRWKDTNAFFFMQLVVGGYQLRISRRRVLQFWGSWHVEFKDGVTQVLAQSLKIELFSKLSLYFGYKVSSKDFLLLLKTCSHLVHVIIE